MKLQRQEIAIAKGLYSQSEEDEHGKLMIPCIKHDGHYFKFCILRSIVLKQFRKSEGLCQTFLQVMLGHSDKTITALKTIV